MSVSRALISALLAFILAIGVFGSIAYEKSATPVSAHVARQYHSHAHRPHHKPSLWERIKQFPGAVASATGNFVAGIFSGPINSAKAYIINFLDGLKAYTWEGLIGLFVMSIVASMMGVMFVFIIVLVTAMIIFRKRIWPEPVQSGAAIDFVSIAPKRNRRKSALRRFRRTSQERPKSDKADAA